MRFAFISDPIAPEHLETAPSGSANAIPVHAFTPTGPKTILLLSVSAGAGHIRAAEAICAGIRLDHPDAKAIHTDVMDHVPAWFRYLYSGTYMTLVTRLPVLWGCLYRTMNNSQGSSALERLRRHVQRLSMRQLLKKIAATCPDIIICTHFLPAEFLAPLAGNKRLGCPVWVQVTDFDLHRMWVNHGVTGYFSPNEEVAFRMRSHGIAAHTIRVTGIPVMPSFSQRPDRAQCARELNVDPDRVTLLLMGGGAGLGRLNELAASLLAMNADFQLIVLAGRNEQLLHGLTLLASSHRGRMVALGYTTRIERLMACADVAITKPGGLTTAECLAVGLPMILHSPIPGQEERNAGFLLEQGVALMASDAVTLQFRVRLLLEHPGKLEEMRRKARALGRPHAARTVASAVMQHACHD